jgi:virulence factor Mce-like protein
MVKDTPSLWRLAAMALFTMSCFAILLFLWISFGGSIPLKPEGYRVKVAFPEAATLAQEADVRLAGVSIGKVKTKELEEGAARTIAELNIDERYAPIPKDTRAILRQKTLLGETYVEFSPGSKASGMVEDGGQLANANVEQTVELDEIFRIFDKPTREAFRVWQRDFAVIAAGDYGEEFNDAFGNLAPFATDGAKLLTTLDEQERAVTQVIRNTGRVFGALNEQNGALGELIVNSNNTFEATASQSEALAETFETFPTFLDESKRTLARLEDFARNTDPLITALKGPADDLGPTVRDLGDLAPDLEKLFRDLDPLITASEKGLPAASRFLRGASPVLSALHTFLPELNPILSLFNFQQTKVAGFISNGAANIAIRDEKGDFRQGQAGVIEPRSFDRITKVPEYDRGNAYLGPNTLERIAAFGVIESFAPCPAGSTINPQAGSPLGGAQPPCSLMPPTQFQNQSFPRLEKGKAPLVPTPRGNNATPVR